MNNIITDEPLFTDFHMQDLEEILKQHGIIIWPRLESPLKFINSSVGTVRAEFLSLKEGESISDRVLSYMKENNKVNFAYYTFSKKRRDIITPTLTIESIFDISFASW